MKEFDIVKSKLALWGVGFILLTSLQGPVLAGVGTQSGPWIWASFTIVSLVGWRIVTGRDLR